MAAAAQLFVVVLGLLLLGAHFLRGGHLPVVIAVLAVAVLLAVRRPWVARTVQVILALGAIEWSRTLAGFVRARVQAGEPVLRLAIILGAVAAVTLLGALAFQTRALGRIYRLGPP